MSKNKTPRRSPAAKRKAKVDLLFQDAIDAFKESNHRVAKKSCTELLELMIDHPGATHLLGQIEFANSTNSANRANGLRLLEKSTQLEKDNFGYLANYGSALLQSGDDNAAIEALKSALVLMPDNGFTLDQLAQALARQDRTDEAIEARRKLVSLSPNQADYRISLSRILSESGSTPEAVKVVREGLQRADEDADLHNQLGYLLMQSNELESAEHSFRTALASVENHYHASSNLGIVLLKQEKFEEAIKQLECATQLSPADSLGHFNLGYANYLARNFEAACEALRESVRIQPKDARSQELLARALVSNGNPDKAIDAVNQWIIEDPDNAVAQHVLASLGQADIPDRASDQYVQTVFDDFSDSYENVLTKIKYQGPRLIQEMLELAFPNQLLLPTVLDAGCGTGLCAPVVRELAATLVGVDLSSGMLEKARATEQYDELVEAELIGYLLGQPNRFDLIVSGDTFNYFGDLSKLLSTARDSLVPNGRLIFTLEVHEDQSGQFQLNPHGRYSHNQNYILESLRYSELIVSETRQCVLRHEANQPVSGIVVLAIRE